jgi:aspartate-semialdehyde dehydrogenase
MKFTVAVTNATNRMGAEIINYLSHMKFPYKEVVALGHNYEAGQKISFGEDKSLTIKPLKGYDFQEADIVFFLYLDMPFAEEYKKMALKTGAIVIDLSEESAFDKSVPSLIPAVNDHDFLLNHESAKLISLPISMSAQLAFFLKPLDMEYNIKRIVVSTYQSVSHTGDKLAMDELFNQTKGIYFNQESKPEYFTHKISFNTLPGIGKITKGVSLEEKRIIADLQKLIKPELNIVVNTAYVPIFVGEAAYVNIEFEKKFALEELKELLNEIQELTIIEEGREKYASHFDALGEENILISRIKKDDTVNSGVGMWSCCDNLRRGIAITAVETAQFLAENLK